MRREFRRICVHDDKVILMYGNKKYASLVLIILLVLLILSACQQTDRIVMTESESVGVEKSETPSDLQVPDDQGSANLPEESSDQPVAKDLSPELLFQTDSLLPAFQEDLHKLSGLSYYRIQVEIQPDMQSFIGQLVLDYTNLEPVELDRLYLRLYPNGGASYGNGELEVSNLMVVGKEVESNLSQSNSVLEVLLEGSLLPGEKTQLSMDFSGKVPVDFGGDESQAYGIFNYTEGVLTLSGWHPILAVYDQDGWNLDPVRPVGDAVYSDMAYYAVQITLPADLTLVATGSEINRQKIDQKTVVDYVSGPAREFFIAASSRFQVVSEEVDGVGVNVYTLEGQSKASSYMLEVSVDSFRVFNQEFGPYPYREIDILQSPMRNAGGVEFPGIVLIEAARSLEPDNSLLATTIAHEVAHQWWYNMVGSDVIDEPWVDEALTTFSSMLYWEGVYGEEAYKGIKSDFQYRFDQASKNQLRSEINDGIDFFARSDNAKEYGVIVYIKGALFFDALRREIGDAVFFSALKSYYQENRYGIAAGDDLLSGFEGESGKSLDEFYQEWLRR